MRCHVPVTSSRGGSVLKCIDEGEDKSTSQVDYKPIGSEIKGVDAFLHCGANWHSEGGNALSQILEDLTNSCISV